MADNIAITSGSGTSVATDDVGGAHYQKIKLYDATADSSAAIPGDATNGLYVNPKRRMLRVQVTPTISSSPAYTSGDCLGGLMSITSATSYSGGGGRLLGVTVIDKTQAQRAAMDILFFSQSVTVAGDNAAFATSDADMAYCVGLLSLGSWSYNTAWAGTPLNSIAVAPPPASAATSVQTMLLPYVCSATTLYAQAVVRGTPTYTSTSDLIFNFLIEPD